MDGIRVRKKQKGIKDDSKMNSKELALGYTTLKCPSDYKVEMLSWEVDIRAWIS